MIRVLGCKGHWCLLGGAVVAIQDWAGEMAGGASVEMVGEPASGSPAQARDGEQPGQALVRDHHRRHPMTHRGTEGRSPWACSHDQERVRAGATSVFPVAWPSPGKCLTVGTTPAASMPQAGPQSQSRFRSNAHVRAPSGSGLV